MTKGNKIQIELWEMNSKLALHQEMPFELPENYFKNLSIHEFDDRSKGKINAAEKELPFMVPQHYFDRLPDILKQRIRKETNESANLFSKYPLLKPMQIAAAVLILVFGGFVFLNHIQPTYTLHQQLVNIPDEVVKDYVAQTDLEINTPYTATTSLSFNKISDEEINEYLKEHSW